MPIVQLVPMLEEEYHSYLHHAVADYAQDLARAGNASPEMALQASENQFHELLPQGLSTPGNHLFSIRDQETGQRVGNLWFAESENRGRRLAFLYDFRIFDEFQRKGYGQAAMLTLEDQVRQVGLNEIRLHVFGDNLAARALYQKVGYIETNVNMAKRLEER